MLQNIKNIKELATNKKISVKTIHSDLITIKHEQTIEKKLGFNFKTDMSQPRAFFLL